MFTWIVLIMFALHSIGFWITGRRLRADGDRIRILHFAVLLGALCAHSAYWILEIRTLVINSRIPTGWFLWANLGSWCAIAALFVKLRKPKYLIFNYFVVPLAMTIFIIGYQQHRGIAPGAVEDFDTHRLFWRLVHSGSLLVGTAIMILSFSAGVLFLVQSIRLKGKQKKLPLKLPSLEKLCSMGEQGMLAAFLAFFLGLISGIVMNMAIGKENPIVDWGHPVVWSSSILLLWIAAATLFSFLYQPARHGRKVAYLSITSGIMIAVEILLVVLSGHGTASEIDHNNQGDILSVGGNLQENQVIKKDSSEATTDSPKAKKGDSE